MKTCPKCKKENLDDATYCAFCGARLEEEKVETSIKVDPFAIDTTDPNKKPGKLDWMKKVNLTSPYGKFGTAKNTPTWVSILGAVFITAMSAIFVIAPKANMGHSADGSNPIMFAVTGCIIAVIPVFIPLSRITQKKGSKTGNLMWMGIHIVIAIGLILFTILYKGK